MKDVRLRSSSVRVRQIELERNTVNAYENIIRYLRRNFCEDFKEN